MSLEKVKMFSKNICEGRNLVIKLDVEAIITVLGQVGRCAPILRMACHKSQTETSQHKTQS